MVLSIKNSLWPYSAWKQSSIRSIKPRLIIVGSLSLFLSILVLVSWMHPPAHLKDAIYSIKDHAISSYNSHFPRVSEDARNSTLGFQKIYYISLPHRTDRQDAITLLSDFTEIDTTYEEAIDGHALDDKWKTIGHKLGAGQFGCWRSHANIWRRMVVEDIETVLVLEDDVDWDVNLKDQLYRISQAILDGPNVVDDSPSADMDRSTPYGTNWDLFPLGYCKHSSPNPGDEKELGPVIGLDDPSLLDFESMNDGIKDELRRLNATENQQRAVTRLNAYYCTQAYAVTKRGARRLLYHFGYRDVGMAIDNMMSWAAEGGTLRGLVAVPPLVQQFKLGASLDSNIDVHGEVPDEVDKEKGSSANIKSSARAAMKEWVSWDNADARTSRK